MEKIEKWTGSHLRSAAGLMARHPALARVRRLFKRWKLSLEVESVPAVCYGSRGLEVLPVRRLRVAGDLRLPEVRRQFVLDFHYAARTREP